MTHFRVIAFGVQSKETLWRTQDAIAFDGNRIAVADGVSGAGYLSGDFANVLVDTFVDKKIDVLRLVGNDGLELHQKFSIKLESNWSTALERFPVPEEGTTQARKLKKDEHISAATFAGVEFVAGKNATDLHIIVFGDAFVFLFPKNREAAVYSGPALASGHQGTDCIKFTWSNRKIHFGAKRGVIAGLSGTGTLLVCTDEIGRYVESQIKTRKADELLDRLRSFRNRTEVLSWFYEVSREQQREKWRVPDLTDDMACVVAEYAVEAGGDDRDPEATSKPPTNQASSNRGDKGEQASQPETSKQSAPKVLDEHLIIRTSDTPNSDASSSSATLSTERRWRLIYLRWNVVQQSVQTVLMFVLCIVVCVIALRPIK